MIWNRRTKMAYFRGVMLVFAIAAVVGLSALLVKAQPNHNEDATNQLTVTTTATLSGTTTVPVAVLAGNKLTITLPSNQTTGYGWKLANQLNPAILKFTGSKYNEPSGGMVGQGGTETWTFQAVGRGKQSITMEYARPWETSAQPAKTQVFSVTVQ
jgi:predicted secreted protein